MFSHEALIGCQWRRPARRAKQAGSAACACESARTAGWWRARRAATPHARAARLRQVRDVGQPVRARARGGARLVAGPRAARARRRLVRLLRKRRRLVRLLRKRRHRRPPARVRGRGGRRGRGRPARGVRSDGRRRGRAGVVAGAGRQLARRLHRREPARGTREHFGALLKAVLGGAALPVQALGEDAL